MDCAQSVIHANAMLLPILLGGQVRRELIVQMAEPTALRHKVIVYRFRSSHVSGMRTISVVRGTAGGFTTILPAAS